MFIGDVNDWIFLLFQSTYKDHAKFYSKNYTSRSASREYVDVHVRFSFENSMQRLESRSGLVRAHDSCKAEICEHGIRLRSFDLAGGLV